MLHASALRALLAENCEDPITCMILTSPTGSIIGTSSTLPSILISKLAVLSSLTWRTHMDVSPRISSTEPLPIIATTKSPSSGTTGETTVLISQYQDYELSIQLILRDILLVVIAEKSTSAKPIPIAHKGLDGQIKAGNASRAEMGIDDVDTEEALAQEQLRGDPVQNQDLLSTNGHVNGNETGPGTDTGENVDQVHMINASSRPNAPEQLRTIILVKGKAMADYLRDEMKGFRMPDLNERA